ncbi:YihY/virulence factor BrkB family protein [Herbaspirillum rubrisubalbicans]|uniref:YihY/virulence factor BrkB family protein n=1 Tax=Herbaspirillum rubrisubalbicans TaxID=80842 RepID=A0AAD0U6I4_9BURK|nr:YihY/virulence factor BrkB family protein [Herbaspirillum rubrisubalbicans]AYR23568.1 YihY/virulence factor BrkB family protein [Herbaspirillum rubrisubalbicans]
MSSSYDPLRSRHPGVADAAPDAADLTPVRDEQCDPDDDGLSGGGFVAGLVLSAGLGLWLGRKRRQRRAQAVTQGAAAPPHERAEQPARELIPHGLERALRLVSLAMPLIAAWRKGAARAKVAAAKAQMDTPLPPDAPARVDIVKARLEPVPSDYLDPAAEVKMLKGGTRAQQAWQMTVAAIDAWITDFAPSMGAAIAYYTIFSIAPMLVIAIAVAGMLFGHDAAQGEIVNQIRDIVGTEGAFAIQGLLRSVSQPREGMIAAGISVVTLVIGATAVFSELQSALDRIWRIPVVKRKSGVWQLARTRLLSFGLILGLGFLLIISLVVSAALAALGRWWGGWFEGWQLVLQLLNFVLSFVVFSTLFSMIYKFMPRVTLSWHDVWIGAVATTVLFIIGKYLIGLYLGSTGMTSGFGAAGSFALLLLWIYYSAQIFLLGAEFTWIYANNFGSRARRQKLVNTVQEHHVSLEQAQQVVRTDAGKR